MAIGHGKPAGSVYGFYNPSYTVPNSIDLTNSIVTSPFYVPSPGDDAIWYAQPIITAPIMVVSPLILMNSQQYFNNLYYDYQIEVDSRPNLSHRPLTQIGIGLGLLSASLIDYMKNGIDHISVWSRQSSFLSQALAVPAPIPFETTQSKTFDIAAEVWNNKPICVPQTFSIVTNVPFFANQANASFIDANIWYAQPIDIPQTLGIIPSISVAPFYVPRQDEINPWQWQAPNPSAVSLELYQRGNDYFYFPVPDLFSTWYAQPIDIPQVLTVPPLSTLADVPVAPLFVPSPPVEAYWQMWRQRVNISVSIVILPFEIDQNNFPSSDVPSVWYAQPKYVPQTLTAPSKPPTPFYADPINFNSNDFPAVWSGKPINASKVIGVTNFYIPVASFYVPRQDDTICWYGQYFGVSQMLAEPPPVIASFYVDTTLWYAESNAVSMPLIYVKPFDTTGIIPVAPFYVPRQDEINPWQWQAPNPSAVSLELYQRGNDYFYFPVPDFFSTWLAQPIDVPAQLTFVPPVSTLGDIPVAPFYVPSPPVEAYWQKPSSYSLSFIPTISAKSNFNSLSSFVDYSDFWRPALQRGLSSLFSPFILGQRSFSADDYGTWRATSTISKTLFPLVTAAGQVKSNQWLFGYDDSSYWTGKPLNIASPIPMLTIGGIIKAKQWHWDNDDPSMWSGWINRDLTNTMTLFVPPNVAIPSFYRFSTDYPTTWQQPSQRSTMLPFVPVIVDRRSFHNDDPPPWQQPTQRSIGLPFVPAIVDHWRIDPIADLPWAFTIQRNISALAQPFIGHWRLDLADDQVWLPAKQRDLVVTVTPLSNRQASSVVVDYIWQPQGQQRSRLYFSKPEIPVFWNFNNDDAALTWHPATQRSLGIEVFLPQYPPFNIRQPSFAHDDHSSYQWLVRSSLILSLRWNINYKRIAATNTERNRIIDVLCESRISITLPENRIVDAIDEED